MKQLLAIALAFVTVGALSLAIDSRTAFACSIAYFDVTQADLVVLGEFVAIDRRGELEPGKPRSPDTLRLNILKVYVGDIALGNQQVEARVRGEPDPFMCPQFQPDRLLGRQAMVVLSETGVTVSYASDRSVVWFLDESASEGIGGDLARLYFAGEAPVAPATVLPPNAGTGASPQGDDSSRWVSVLAVALLVAPLALTAALRRR